MIAQPKKILHLTDLHLFDSINTKLVGVNPLHTLQKIIAKISDELDKNRPDLIVMTGDVSQDYSISSYKIAKKILEQFESPIISTAGNHDYLPFFQKIIGDPSQEVKKIDGNNNWHIVLLNSHWPHNVSGKLDQNNLNFLKKTLDNSKEDPVVIFLHHHVLPISSHWIDSIKLENSDEFLKIIDRYNNIKAIICGHVHQDTTIIRNNIPFVSTPSTSWQFKPKNRDFKLDELMPGYRWIYLYDDGTIQTEVVRVEYDSQLVPDLGSEGY